MSEYTKCTLNCVVGLTKVGFSQSSHKLSNISLINRTIKIQVPTVAISETYQNHVCYILLSSIDIAYSLHIHCIIIAYSLGNMSHFFHTFKEKKTLLPITVLITLITLILLIFKLNLLNSISFCTHLRCKK